MRTEQLILDDAIFAAPALPPPPMVAGGFRPRMVIGHSNPYTLAGYCRHFRRLGWDVWGSMGGREARRLAYIHEPAVVILETDLPDQTGWLSCFKIVRDGGCRKVILLASAPDQASPDFAQFVGATAMVLPVDGMDALVDAVYDTDLAAVC